MDEELESLPFSYEEKVQVTVNENHLTAVVDFGLVLKLSEGNGDVVVSVPRSYAGFLCGLCGNANGDLTDDEAHGDTWEVGCTPGCSPDCPPCTLAELERYQDDKYCGLLRPVSGPLASCHNTIPVSPFFDDCITNTCEARGRLDVWCNVIAAYATACQDKGIPVGEWRTDTFCSESELWRDWVQGTCLKSTDTATLVCSVCVPRQYNYMAMFMSDLKQDQFAHVNDLRPAPPPSDHVKMCFVWLDTDRDIHYIGTFFTTQ